MMNDECGIMNDERELSKLNRTTEDSSTPIEEDIEVTPEFWKDLKVEAASLLKKHPPKLRQRRKR